MLLIVKCIRTRPLKIRLLERKGLNQAALSQKSRSPENIVPADPNTCSEKKQLPLTDRLNFAKQITRSSGDDAVHALNVFTDNDIFMLKEKKLNIVSHIIAQPESYDQLKEETARLLNAICSYYNGRTYVTTSAQRKELVSSVLAALKSKKLSNYAAQHAIAALQKLSLRITVQKDLISLGMMEWLTFYLETMNVDNFPLEYGCALLLNLSINPASHSTASRIANQLVATLISLLKRDNETICKYVNGALFVLLSINRVASAASQIGLETVLRSKLERRHCNDDVMQIPQIFKVLRGGNAVNIDRFSGSGGSCGGGGDGGDGDCKPI
uniref:PUL domain-containing protein n=1 Tax=Syphacia muris TaxID=451379 RepID=A0A158R5Q9_9BILA